MILFGCCFAPWARQSTEETPTTTTVTPSPSSSPPADPIDWDKTHAWTMAKQFIKQRLKAPSTADFGSMWNGTYQDPDDCVSRTASNTYMAVGWVDSQNSFGAMIRTTFVVKLRDDKNGKWTLLEEPTLVSP